MGHCKFAEMLYFSDELVVVVCFFSKTASIISTTATEQSVKSVYAFIHYAFGGVSATRAFALWCSTSASGPTRRVPPPRGSPPRCPSRAFPSSLASSPPLFPLRGVTSFRGASPVGPFPEWSTFPSFFVYVVFLCGPLCAVIVFILGARRTCFPSAVDFTFCNRIVSISSLLWMCSAGSQCTGAVGRVSRPRSSTWTYSFFVFLPFHCSRVRGSRVAPLCLPFKFSSGVVRRSTCVVCLVSVSQLSWSGQVGRLPSCVQVIGLS